MKRGLLFAIVLTAPLLAAGPSLSGSVLDDSGSPVPGAELLISQALPAAGAKFAAPPVVTGRLVARTAADAQGNFSISGLPSGQYVVCAEAVSRAVLDPCLWAASAPTATVVVGQAVTGLKVVMTRGAMLTIDVSDPLSLLTPVTGPIDLNFDVQVVTAKGLPYSARIQQSTAVSRVHAIAVPFDTPLSLRVLASRFAVTDQAGNAVSRAATALSVPAGTVPAPIVYTVAGTKAAPGGPVGASGVTQPGTAVRRPAPR